VVGGSETAWKKRQKRKRDCTFTYSLPSCLSPCRTAFPLSLPSSVCATICATSRPAFPPSFNVSFLSSLRPHFFTSLPSFLLSTFSLSILLIRTFFFWLPFTLSFLTAFCPPAGRLHFLAIFLHSSPPIYTINSYINKLVFNINSYLQFTIHKHTLELTRKEGPHIYLFMITIYACMYNFYTFVYG
jgi:hypothetical protein